MDGDNPQYNASNQRYGNGQNAVNNHKKYVIRKYNWTNEIYMRSDKNWFTVNEIIGQTTYPMTTNHLHETMEVKGFPRSTMLSTGNEKHDEL